jgi:hypothetical protein
MNVYTLKDDNTKIVLFWKKMQTHANYYLLDLTIKLILCLCFSAYLFLERDLTDLKSTCKCNNYLFSTNVTADSILYLFAFCSEPSLHSNIWLVHIWTLWDSHLSIFFYFNFFLLADNLICYSFILPIFPFLYLMWIIIKVSRQRIYWDENLKEFRCAQVKFYYANWVH